MSLLRKIAFPVSLIYACVVYLRNRFYDVGFFTSKRFETPTLCVGNLSVGGTGKTPMVEYLIGLLSQDYKVAVLSRGYKRKSKGFILATPERTVEELGDEPFQLYSKFTDLIVAVDADRQNGILQLEKVCQPDVILLDDAFQHRKVKADLNLLLTSYHQLYIDDWYLPTGNLRDHKSQVKRADLIVVTKCPTDLSKEERHRINQKLTLNYNPRVLFSYLHYENNLKSENGTTQGDFLESTPFTLVTGIADPKPLVAYLENEGMFFEHLAFKDHHFFTSEEVRLLNTKGFVLTTEKDFMRLRGRVNNLFYLPVSHAFFDGDDGHLKEEVSKLMKPIY